MTKIKTSELQGAALDWAVAEAVGVEVDIRAESPCKVHDSGGVWLQPTARRPYMPSSNWGQGGPLIEAYHVDLESNLADEWAGSVAAEDPGGDPRWISKTGPTPLIAACRAIVAAKMGDEVDVPEELA